MADFAKVSCDETLTEPSACRSQDALVDERHDVKVAEVHAELAVVRDEALDAVCREGNELKGGGARRRQRGQLRAQPRRIARRSLRPHFATEMRACGKACAMSPSLDAFTEPHKQSTTRRMREWKSGNP